MRWDEVATPVSVRQELTQAAGLVTHHIEAHTLMTDTGKKLVLEHQLADIVPLGEEVERQGSRGLLLERSGYPLLNVSAHLPAS